jgi:hypothetical protein
MVDIQDPFMPALMALHPERPHAVVTHIFQRHRLDWIIEARDRHHHRPSRARTIAGLSGFLTLIIKGSVGHSHGTAQHLTGQDIGPLFVKSLIPL